MTSPAWSKLKQHPAVRRRADLKKRYGITLGDYTRMFEEQDGRCALCFTEVPGKARKHFAVDHDHVTKKVRGLLCDVCNRMLGLARENPATLEAAARYLRVSRRSPFKVPRVCDGNFG